MDPPDPTRIRWLVGRAFTPPRVERLRGPIRHTADRRTRSCQGSGRGHARPLHPAARRPAQGTRRRPALRSDRRPRGRADLAGLPHPLRRVREHRAADRELHARPVPAPRTAHRPAHGLVQAPGGCRGVSPPRGPRPAGHLPLPRRELGTSAESRSRHTRRSESPRPPPATTPPASPDPTASTWPATPPGSSPSATASTAARASRRPARDLDRPGRPAGAVPGTRARRAHRTVARPPAARAAGVVRKKSPGPPMSSAPPRGHHPERTVVQEGPHGASGDRHAGRMARGAR